METEPSPKAPSCNRQSSIINLQSSIHFAPAKLNVRLKITGRRPDGYHNLVSIMAPVSLYDRIELQITSRNLITISCAGFSVPADKENLACRAAQAFFAHTGIEHGLSIKLTKNIPVAAGLGGGSSDAACVLKALNQIWSYPLSVRELAELTLGLGADVPFFLTGKPCIVRGIGEILDPIEKWPKLWYIIVTPPIRVSTAWVYGNLDWSPLGSIGELELTKDEYQFIIANLKKKALVIDRILENDLERVTASHFPAIEDIKRALMDSGANGVLMSGSGPSVFGIFESKDRARQAKPDLTSLDMGDIFLAEGLP
ncbi:MAG: 4-(cytidine 5'-diphospho)-2-C-methyl-D-erythritol kinase [Desulfobacteraceae bacterium]|nr:4-(cytidine 5'-diphospho)-2-C-methyl-D-erythritol kinase [Desulfobacteraceae bacterium]